MGGALLGNCAAMTLPAWPVQRIFAPIFGSTAAVIEETWLTRPVTGFRPQRRDCLVSFRKPALWRDWNWTRLILLGVQGCSALQAASAEAYRRIFRLLEMQQLPHLWRVWNYLAAINQETDGLERYRQFNIGRQDAFLECQRGATGNVPAACALGLAGGPLSIAFMAGDQPAVPLENPRQVSAYNYPGRIRPA
jgi:chorismate lyase/3-hydroxybenzoate synthase